MTANTDALSPDRHALVSVATTTARLVADHAEAGRAHLLNRDTLRWTVIEALLQHGLRPDEFLIDAVLLQPGPIVDILVVPDTGTTTSISVCYQPRATARVYRTWIETASIAARTPAHERWIVAILPSADYGRRQVPDVLGSITSVSGPGGRSPHAFLTECVTSINCGRSWNLLAHQLPYTSTL